MAKDYKFGSYKFGPYKFIGIVVDSNKVTYTVLKDDGTVLLTWVVEKAFAERKDVYSIHDKSDKQYLVVDLAVSNGKEMHRVNGMSLARKVYECITGERFEDNQVIHHILGQLICLMEFMIKMEKAQHDALPKNKHRISVEEFFLRYVVTQEEYHEILMPNLKLILSWMRENEIKTNYVSVGDICLYKTKLDSISNWQELIVTKKS